MTIRNSPKKPVTFFKVYITVFSIILVIIAVALGVLWFAMDDMEENMPTTLLKPIITDLNDKNVDALFNNKIVSLSEFETKESFSKFIQDLEMKEKIEYTRKIVANDSEYVYVLKSGDQKIGEVTLKKTGEKSKFGNEKFELISLSDFVDGNNKIIITAPMDAKVFINGVLVNNSYSKETGIEIQELEYVPENIPKKTFAKYEIGGLFEDAKITATGYQGNELKLVETNVDNSIQYSFDYDGISSEASQYDELITEVSQSFAKHVTDDLNFSGVAKYLARESPIYDIIRRTEFYWYTPHDKYEFKNTEYLDFKQYSENCISYRIKFDHYVYRISANVTSHKECDYTFVFVKEDDKWLVYDMTINSK